MKRLAGLLLLTSAFVIGQTPRYVPDTGGTFKGPVKFGTSIDLADGTSAASVLAFGAKCDGSTDDTTAIQNALNWISTNHGTLSFPAGTCDISASLVFPFTQHVRLTGQSKLGTTIEMTSSNVPILVANQPNTHSIEIDHLTLAFGVHQPFGNTQAYGIQWTNAVGSDSSGFYRWNVHDVQIDGAYVGMGIYNPFGQETVWGSLFQDVTITNTSQSALSFVPTTPIGMPTNVFINLAIFDTGGGAPVPNGPAIILSAMEASFIGLDVEGWVNESIWSTGGGFVNVIGCHVEHETLTTSGRFFYMANGPILLDGCDLSIDGTPTLTGAQVIGEGTGATLTLRNDTIFVSPTGGSTFYWTTANIASSLTFFNLNDALSGVTSMIGVVPISAVASWDSGPTYYQRYNLTQATPQAIQEGTNSASTAAYLFAAGPDASTSGLTFLRNSGSPNNWTMGRAWFDGNKFWNVGYCAAVTSITAACTSAVTAFQVRSTTSNTATLDFNSLGAGHTFTFPNADLSFPSSGVVGLTETQTLTNKTVNGVAPALAVSGGTSAVGQALCQFSAGPPQVIGHCTSAVGAGGACTCAN